MFSKVFELKLKEIKEFIFIYLNQSTTNLKMRKTRKTRKNNYLKVAMLCYKQIKPCSNKSVLCNLSFLPLLDNYCCQDIWDDIS